MENSDLDLTTKFYLDVDAKYMRLTDITDYAGEGESTAYVYVNFAITTPSGLTYNNTNYDSSADIVGSTGTMYKDFILPLDGVYVKQGSYSIVMTVQIIDGVNIIEEYTQTFAYTYSFTEPVLAVTFDIDGYNSTFSVADSTTYITTGYSALTASRTIVTTPPDVINMAVDTDVSANTTTTLDNEYIANIYSGVYSTVLTVVLTYTMNDDLVIYFADSLTDTDTAYNIAMDTLRVAVYSYLTTYYTELENSGFDASEIENNVVKMATSLGLYTISLNYQDLEDAYDSALRIYEIIYADEDVDVEEITPFENSYSFTNTDEKVKENSGTTAHYLEDLIDDVTIEFSGGKLQVVGSLSDYVSKASGGIFGGAITVTGIITATSGTSTQWNTAYTHSQLASGNPHSVTPTELGLVIGTNVQAYDAGLLNLAAVTMAADKYYYTSADNVHVAGSITAYGRSLVAVASEAAFKTLVNLEIGTDVLAQKTIGIANDNLVEIDGTPANGEYALFTANGLDGITGAALATAIMGSVLHNSLSDLNNGTAINT